MNPNAKVHDEGGSDGSMDGKLVESKQNVISMKRRRYQ